MISMLKMFLPLVILFTPPKTFASDLDFLPSQKSRVGKQKLALIFAFYEELVEEDSSGKTTINKTLLSGLFKTQPEQYFSWSSYGLMDLEVDIYYHPLGMAERDGVGSCRDHPGLLFDDVAGLDTSLYDVKYFVDVITSTNCGGSCSSGVGGVVCTTMYFSLTAEPCNYGHPYGLCESVFIHEALHAFGLGYHQNAYQCTYNEANEMVEDSWRDCTQMEYGNVLDALGSGTSGDKVSWGVSAKSRYDLGWLDADDIEVVTKTDATDSWEVTTVVIDLLPEDSDNKLTAGSRAALIRFTDPALSSLGMLWLEFRGGNGFDTGLDNAADGYNHPSNGGGVFGMLYGNSLIDFAADNSVDDFKKVSLNVGAGPWNDISSGLQLETISVDAVNGAKVRITFNKPPVCVAARPSLNLPGYYGGYMFFLAKGDLELYKEPEGEGWGVQEIRSWIGEYMPYWSTVELDDFKAVLSYQLSAKNNDGASCDKSHMSVRV